MASKSDPKTYTKPEVRDKIKDRVTKGDKGGRPGQWSARKAQLVTQEYEKEGGAYKKPRNEGQKSLKQWGDEKWSTADGSKAQEDGKTKRYLPQKAWDQLSPAEKKATNKKKIEGSKKGQQFVANTTAAATARKKAAGSKPAAKKAAAKKAAAKKTVAKKAAKKSPARKAPAKKSAKKVAKKAGSSRSRA